jgi:hypothetical protein
MATDALLGQAILAAHGAALHTVIDTLIKEFDGLFPAGAVIGQVTRSREQLHAQGVRAGLAEATEAMARLRLRQLLGSPASR